MFRNVILSAVAALALQLAPILATPALAQATNCKVTTAAPTYANNATAPISCDTSGGLRTSGGGGGGGAVDLTAIDGNAVQVTTPGVLDVNVVNSSGGGAVDITDIGGNAVTVTVPGALDITCVSGCVGGSGVSQGTATTAAPTYVDATNNPLSLTLAGSLRTSNTTALPAGTNNIGDVDVLTLPALPAGANVIGAVTQSGTWNIGSIATLPSIPAGANVIGGVTQSGTWNVATVSTVTAVTAITNALPAGTNNIGDVDVLTLPALANQATLNYSLVAANSTNATNVKNGAGVVYELSLYNNSAVIAYLKLYDSASAPTCGSGTPVARYLIPASASGAGSNVTIPLGKTFPTGIGFCLTTGIGDADTGAVAASAYLVNLTYK